MARNWPIAVVCRSILCPLLVTWIASHELGVLRGDSANHMRTSAATYDQGAIFSLDND